MIIFVLFPSKFDRAADFFTSYLFRFFFWLFVIFCHSWLFLVLISGSVLLDHSDDAQGTIEALGTQLV